MKNRKITSKNFKEEIANQKQDAARYALFEVLNLAKRKKKIKIGLGSGSTVALFVKELAKYKNMIKASYYASSRQILNEAKKQGINTELIEKPQAIDIAVDGIDAVDERKNALKGLGAFAIYGEKLIDYNAKKLIFIGDSRKLKVKLDLSKLIVAAKNAKALKMLGKIKQVAKDDYGNDIYIFIPKFKLPPKLMEKLLDKYGVSGIFTKHNKEKTKIVIANSRKFQLALDVNLNKAKEILIEIKKQRLDFILDYIEIGTPLLKHEGIYGIKEIKKLWRGKIFIDTKTADTGNVEAKLLDYGNSISVLAVAPLKTIEEVIGCVDKKGKEVVIDFIGVKEDKIKERAKEILKSLNGLKNRLNNIYFCIHTGIDEQSGKFINKTIKEIKAIKEIANGKVKIAVAGGINNKNIDEVLVFNPDLIIIGSYLTKVKKKELKERLINLWKKIKFITY